MLRRRAAGRGTLAVGWLLLLCPALAAAKRHLPESLSDRDVFCETCYATVSEMYRLVKRNTDGSLEQRIDGALQRVCAPDLMAPYQFPSDLLVPACRDLIVRFENDLGLGLLAAFQPGKKPRAAATVRDICFTRMKACKQSQGIPSLRKLNETAAAKRSPAGDGAVTETSSPGANSAGTEARKDAMAESGTSPGSSRPSQTSPGSSRPGPAPSGSPQPQKASSGSPQPEQASSGAPQPQQASGSQQSSASTKDEL